ncbi:GNAT family N-acetyltransferase (plasmid) [Enterococcus faecium]|nr:GNAT family N-acetyltransferase [Enterococcus faecalis]QUR72464.1 GNAT family N-acetyltransferase [Enterococcus faecium]
MFLPFLLIKIDDNMVFDIDNLKGFLNDTSSFGFIAKENNKIIGFAYCYTLLRPDGKTMFYLHSIGMLPNYQDKGYETKMYVMAVPKINSYLGTIERYETMYADDPMTARATPKQAHDIVVKNLPTNLETLHKTGLFSDIRLYNREGVKLYSSLETPSISPKETLERELNRKVSGKEIQPTLERIEQKMLQNQHQETPEFKAIQQKMESLQPPTPPIPKTPKLPGI